jgi:hypothetical protein
MSLRPPSRTTELRQPMEKMTMQFTNQVDERLYEIAGLDSRKV